MLADLYCCPLVLLRAECQIKADTSAGLAEAAAVEPIAPESAQPVGRGGQSEIAPLSRKAPTVDRSSTDLPQE
jgi:hypothetical protein